jgi:hypothetical protein
MEEGTMRLTAGVMKRFVFVALVIGGAALPPGSVSSGAYPHYEEAITYYSDASYSQVVGTAYVACNGLCTQQGTTSPFEIEEYLDPCCGGVPC